MITGVFENAKGRYGHRRVHVVVKRQGHQIAKKTVLRLMRELGLRSHVRRRKGYSSYHGISSQIAPNVLKRDFTTGRVNEKWVSDVTEFRVAGAKLYLSPVLDLHDRSIRAFTTSLSPNTAFTSASLRAALTSSGRVEGVMVHTDQGVQYQHSSWRVLIAEHGGVQSMSRRGNCYDNAVAENFFGHLKAEMFHHESFTSVVELETAIGQYIQWWNTQRVQEGLGGLTPAEYRELSVAG